MLVLSTCYLLAVFYKQCSVWRQPSWYQTEETPTLKQPQNRVLVFSLCFALSGLCLLPVAQRTAAASCADDVTLDSQVAINNFASDYAGCTSLGSLRVQEAVDGDIQSLEGLSQLTSVDGALQIFNNARLLTVDGLEKITSVGAQLDLYNNARLNSINGLRSVTQVGGFLDISYSSYLPNVNALANVASVGTRLRLFHLYGLHDCKGIAPFIRSLPDNLAARVEKVKVGLEGQLPRNGSGANSIAACLNSDQDHTNGLALSGSKPSIVVFIMDDVGLDQLSTFNYGGTVPPLTPSLDQIANAGARFTNVWAMPECSPSRIALFTGQLPVMSGTTGALGPSDLANSQLNPYQDTLVDHLGRAGYTSAMVGKWHMGGPENNEAEKTTPIEAGFDYYYGNVHGFLRSIDTTAGGVAAKGTYSCGFVPSIASDPNHGADTGACYTESVGCSVMSTPAIAEPGRTCMEQGGLFDPGATSCLSSPPATLDFELENAYYVGKLEKMSRPVSAAAPIQIEEFTTREYRTSVESNEAIRWLNARSADEPYFLAVSYSAAHTPLQQIPQVFGTGGIGVTTSSSLDCSDSIDQRALQKAIISFMSEEIGRVLVESGLMARTGAGGSLELTAKGANTLIVILGDNGTLGYSVNLPFDPTRAKGQVYQTGVQVPLLIAGAGVGDTGLARHGLASIIDIYGAISDAAGLDLLPGSTPFNPVSLAGNMAHAQTANQRSQIAVNVAPNIQANDVFNPPCALGTACSVTPINKGVCEDNNGVWYGPGATGLTAAGSSIPSTGFTACWAANQFLYGLNEPLLNVLPTDQSAAATETYKYVVTSWVDYDPQSDGPNTTEIEELFLIKDANGDPLIDRESLNLLAAQSLTNDASLALEVLKKELQQYQSLGNWAAEDGNRDGTVDNRDLTLAQEVATTWGLSSFYDVNQDGVTNTDDLRAIEEAIARQLGVPIPAVSGFALLILALSLGTLAYRRLNH